MYKILQILLKPKLRVSLQNQFYQEFMNVVVFVESQLHYAELENSD